MAEVRGVNLGGWFVLERWMTPDLFNGVSGPDETVFCKEVNNAYERLKHHWETFITEDDFAYIKQLGLNSVRIPVPWWAFEKIEPYYQCTNYIEKAMEWAQKYQLKVLLDLHTAPGCQNGFDNGGITGVIDWPQKNENIELTIEVIKKIVKIFSRFESLWGIEVLNEPHWTIDLDLIQSFYLRVYKEIRKYRNDLMIVFHDSFRPNDTSWFDFFTKNQLKNVLFDLHLYQCFDQKYLDYQVEQHIIEAISIGNDLIRNVSKFVPVIVGEWSLGLHNKVLDSLDVFNQNNVLKMYALAQLHSYEKGYGWYFWSYKLAIKNKSGWYFKKMIEDQIIPNHYYKS